MKNLVSYRFVFYLGLFVFFISCSTSQQLFTMNELKETPSLSSRVETFYWDDTLKKKQKARGVMRWVKGCKIQLSFRVPFVQSEAMRVEFSPTKIELFNRLDKEYVELSYVKLKGVFPQLVSFEELEEILYLTLQSGKKSKISGDKLGLSAFSGYDLFIERVNLEPIELFQTKVPKSYNWVSEDDFINQINLYE